MGASAQVNVRMDPLLKAAGDTGLADIGFSPSEAVRALWTLAARRGKDALQVKKLLASASSPTVEEAVAEEPDVPEVLRRGWNIVPEGMAKLGITLKPHGDDWPSDEEFLVQALEERLQERGCL
jgi:antitoxin component of RelBE/YafQ-DinJ toxin-antitoxin module